MVVVIYDIGAGDLEFAVALQKGNPDSDLLIFCGEPLWRFSNSIPRLWGVKSENAARRLIGKSKPGIYRINGTYNSFLFEDQTLDIVTLNSPNPEAPPWQRNMPYEIDRCLKAGGIFYFGHSTHINIDLPPQFEMIAEGDWSHNGNASRKSVMPKNFPKRFPTSPIIASNIEELRKREEGIVKDVDPEWVYEVGGVPLYPNFKIWRKVK